MTNPSRSIRGMAEAEWSRCANPLRMTKVIRGLPPRRKCALLACAYVLDPIAGFHSDVARRVAHAAQAEWAASDPRTGSGTAVAAALRRAFPDELIETPAAAVSLREHALREPDYWPFQYFLSVVAGHSLPTRAAVNAVADGCLRTARTEARTDVTRRLSALRAEHPSEPAFREAVLGLLPEVEREKFAAVRVTEDRVPTGVAHRLGTLAANARAAAVGSHLAGLAREILGNPFRPPAVLPEWREANFAAAVRIAEHATATGDYSHLPILADALEDAGCADAELLAHCRAASPHVPGCWAVDAVLGKN